MPHRPYITFRLGADRFALPVSQVREVLDLESYTRLPMAPDYLLGMVNLRGSAIPLVDLRLKFGLSATPSTLQTRILVMELEHEGSFRLIGGLADSVDEVIELDSGALTPAPGTGFRWKAEVVEAVALVERAFVIILRLAGVFSEEELLSLDPSDAPRLGQPPSE